MRNKITKKKKIAKLFFPDIKKWIKEELESTDVDVLDIPTMEKVVEGGSPFVIMFVDDPKKELNSEPAILKVADKYDIGVAKVEGLSTKYGIGNVKLKYTSLQFCTLDGVFMIHSNCLHLQLRIPAVCLHFNTGFQLFVYILALVLQRPLASILCFNETKVDLPL